MADHANCNALKLDTEARPDARRRLLSIEGHVRGILKMLDDDGVYCVDVLKQIKAVEGALAKTGDVILKAHLKSHVTTAADRGDVDAIVEELMDVLKYKSRS
jgi:DNA-binding FrmR family transcriptional regulator